MRFLRRSLAFLARASGIGYRCPMPLEGSETLERLARATQRMKHTSIQLHRESVELALLERRIRAYRLPHSAPQVGS
jgi:hypothetical protein